MLTAQEVLSQDEEAKRRGYLSEINFLVDKKLKKKDYVEVWPMSGWYRKRDLIGVVR